MHLVDSFWTSVTIVVGFFSLSPNDGIGDDQQIPLLGPSNNNVEIQHHHTKYQEPIFKPPGGSLSGPGSDFKCDYNDTMPQWSPCSTPENRTCWLKNRETNDTFDIYTDYESKTPNGTYRFYELDLTDDTVINADGVAFDHAKLFDRQYPGTWIQACWGDNVTVKVNNWLRSNGGNGTSIHWHGIRQLNTTHMDGVNGVTQCPIAPGDSFTYSWIARQYGSAWYHSHHSVQYADGALGPLTLHGPAILPYDEAKDPILMTDWGHNSAFDAIQRKTNQFDVPSILLNGIGNVTRYNNSFVAPLKIPQPYSITFDNTTTQGRPKRYLLRLINTSFASSFVFSIDNHLLQVVGADFVPIHSYNTTSVLVAVGQRYHVIVEAKPQYNGTKLPDDGNYWIRTAEAKCAFFSVGRDPGYDQAGILRYNPQSTAFPETKNWTNIDTTCTDEDYANLVPVVPWNVSAPVNNGGKGESLFVTHPKDPPAIFPLASWSLGGDGKDFVPLEIDYGNPTFLNLNYSGKWNPNWVVYPENYTNTSWIHFGITGSGGHPIHLHGHDFAILQQSKGKLTAQSLNLTLYNPPRRDVVLVPFGGFVIIAFRTDNPGPWLMHCHIAFHASNGLAIQILERQHDAAVIWPSFAKSDALNETQRVCDNWNKWWGDCRNWWPGDGKSCGIGESGFSPDSGI